VKNFHKAIRKAAEEKLGRSLTTKENEFLRSRQGFIALVMILDTVNSSTAQEVEDYLNSE
jgi:hypothetical protein